MRSWQIISIAVAAVVTAPTVLVALQPPVWLMLLLGPMTLATLYIIARQRSRFDPLDPRFGMHPADHKTGRQVSSLRPIGTGGLSLRGGPIVPKREGDGGAFPIEHVKEQKGARPHSRGAIE